MKLYKWPLSVHLFRFQQLFFSPHLIRFCFKKKKDFSEREREILTACLPYVPQLAIRNLPPFGTEDNLPPLSHLARSQQLIFWSCFSNGFISSYNSRFAGSVS